MELAQSAGLEVDNGVVVDDHCQTSDPDIYAAGDCTNHPNPILGRRLPSRYPMRWTRLEPRPNILGGDKTYAAVLVWSDQPELKLKWWVSQAMAHPCVVAMQKICSLHSLSGDGAIVAVDAVNSPKGYGGQTTYLKWRSRSTGDPDTDLKEILAEAGNERRRL